MRHSTPAMYGHMLWLLIVLGVCGCIAQEPSVEYGYKRYIEYHEGSSGSPLLITIPQGGSKVLHGIPARYRGCWDAETRECHYAHQCPENTEKLRKRCLVSGGSADYTITLGKMARWWIGQVTGVFPHLVLSTPHRKYMDPDNDKDMATFGNQEAAMAYDDYHHFIHRAEKEAHLLVNLRGHNRHDDQIELVYLSQPTNHVSNIPPVSTSMDYLYHTSHNAHSLEDMLLGATSLGGYFESAGYNSIPSPGQPDIHSERYVRGDYTLQRYSHDGNLSAVELSIPRLLRGGVAGPEFAEDMARVLIAFLSEHLPPCGQACTINEDVHVTMMDYFEYNAGSKLESGLPLVWTLITVVILV